MRKQAREYTFKLIFEYLFIKDKNDNGIQEAKPKDLTKQDLLYIENAYNGVIDKYDYLYQNISNLSKEYKVNRIYKVDLAILLLSMYEIDFIEDVPEVVAINEAVELSKTYSTDKSHSFINGLLASYLKSKKEVKDVENN